MTATRESTPEEMVKYFLDELMDMYEQVSKPIQMGQLKHDPNTENDALKKELSDYLDRTLVYWQTVGKPSPPFYLAIAPNIEPVETDEFDIVTVANFGNGPTSYLNMQFFKILIDIFPFMVEEIKTLRAANND